MQFTLAKFLAATLFANSSVSAQDCIAEADFNATIQWDFTTTPRTPSGDMEGTMVDQGVQTCSNVKEAIIVNPTQWTWDCITGYSLTSTTAGAGLHVEYCQPTQCNLFEVLCNYADDAIKCEKVLCA